MQCESQCSVKWVVSNEIHDVTILARLWCHVCTNYKVCAFIMNKQAIPF